MNQKRGKKGMQLKASQDFRSEQAMENALAKEWHDRMRKELPLKPPGYRFIDGKWVRP